MLVIHRLLFKPMLRVMDARREKIASAQTHLDQLEQRYAQEEQEKEAARAAEKKLLAQKREQERRTFLENSGEARQALLRKNAEEFQSLEKESMEIIGGRDEVLEDSLDRLADLYIKKVVSDF